jgi:DNA-binding SARP family transcriptional activator
MPRETFDLRVLGPLRLDDPEGKPVEVVLAQTKRAALLTYLALARPRGPKQRDTLLALFWPEADADAARNALNQALHFLRRALGEEVVLGNGTQQVSVEPSRVRCDAVEFEELLAASRYAEAVALYEGPLLSGFHCAHAPDLTRWIESERARLAARYSDALEHLARDARAAGDREAAVRWWQQAAAVDPLSARSTAGLMRALADAGRRSQAMRQGEVHRDLMRHELELGPEPEIVALEAELREGSAHQSEVDTVRTVTAQETVPPSTPPLHTLLHSPPRSNTRRWMFAPAAAFLIALLSWAAAHARSNNESAIVRERVLVAAFENRTSDSTLADLGSLAADYITDGLLRSGVVQVVDPATAFYAVRDTDNGNVDFSAREEMHKVARSVRAGTIVWGTIYESGDSTVYEVRISDVSSRQLIGTVNVAGSGAESQTTAIEEVRERVGGLIASHFDVNLTSLGSSQLPPPRLEAYREYAKGLARFQRHEYRDALADFLRASQLDSTFFLPLSWAIYAAHNGGQRGVRDSLVRVITPMRERLSPLDQYALDNHIWWGKDWVKHHGAVASAARLAPGSNWSYMHGMFEIAAFRPRSAVRALELVDRDRGWARGWAPVDFLLADALHLTGDYKRELAVARRGSARAIRDGRFADAATLYSREVAALAGIGDVNSIRKLLPKLESTARQANIPSALRAEWHMGYAAMALLYHGFRDEGMNVLARAERVADARYARGDTASSFSLKARRAYYRWDLAEVERLAHLTLSLDSAAGRQPNLEMLGYLALSAAAQGRGNEAERWVHVAVRTQTPTKPRTHDFYLQATVAALSGDTQQAVRLLRECVNLSQGGSTEMLMDPAFRPIRNSRAFRALFREET